MTKQVTCDFCDKNILVDISEIDDQKNTIFELNNIISSDKQEIDNLNYKIDNIRVTNAELLIFKNELLEKNVDFDKKKSEEMEKMKGDLETKMKHIIDKNQSYVETITNLQKQKDDLNSSLHIRLKQITSLKTDLLKSEYCSANENKKTDSVESEGYELFRTKIESEIMQKYEKVIEELKKNYVAELKLYKTTLGNNRGSSLTDLKKKFSVKKLLALKSPTDLSKYIKIMLSDNNGRLSYICTNLEHGVFEFLKKEKGRLMWNIDKNYHSIISHITKILKNAITKIKKQLKDGTLSADKIGIFVGRLLNKKDRATEIFSALKIIAPNLIEII